MMAYFLISGIVGDETQDDITVYLTLPLAVERLAVSSSSTRSDFKQSLS